MYGMIHRGIRQLVLDHLGEHHWSEIEREIGIGPAHQISMSLYEDELTFRMVSAVSEKLELEVGECLHSFGRYWVSFAERGSYGDIMDFTGNDLVSFIANLDRMHQAVMALMPEAKVPSFCILDQQEGRLRVRYVSERTGLEPFVAGLFEGLLERFGLNGSVVRDDRASNYPEFILTYSDA